MSDYEIIATEMQGVRPTAKAAIPIEYITREELDDLRAPGENLELEEPPAEEAEDANVPLAGPLALAFPCTDAGNAELFAHLFGDRLRFDYKRGCWLWWHEHFWYEDGDGGVMRLALAAARSRARCAAAIQDARIRNEVTRWATLSESQGKLRAALNLARCLGPIADAGRKWNTDPWLLATRNGVVELRTGQLRAGHPDDKLTLCTGASFDPDATCPRWMQFLEEVFCGDEEMISFIQRAAGYSTTGDISEQCLFLLYGTGANGKSRYLQALANVLGDYAQNTPFSMLERAGRGSIPNDVAALQGRRFVTASETREDGRLNEERVKALTGGDPITARFLHREFFTFEATCKIWLALNHLPQVNDMTDGFWRRIRVVPFRQQFEGEADDKHLDHKLRAEAPGILAWAVRGCLEWQERGLDTPPIVIEATQQYRQEADPLAPFLSECCSVGEDHTARARPLHQAYLGWCDRHEVPRNHILSETKFGRLVGQRFRRDHDRGGWFYYGVGLQTTQRGETSGL